MRMEATPGGYLQCVSSRKFGRTHCHIPTLQVPGCEIIKSCVPAAQVSVRTQAIPEMLVSKTEQVLGNSGIKGIGGRPIFVYLLAGHGNNILVCIRHTWTTL